MTTKLVFELPLLTFLIILTSFISDPIFAEERRVLIDDFEFEKKVEKVKKSQNLKRPPACVCSKETKLKMINEGSASLKGYIWNCICGKAQCLITTGNKKHGDTAIFCSKE